MLEALKQGFGGLLTFSGRMRPMHFWLYFAVIFLAIQAVAGIGGFLMMQGMFARMGRFMREHPDQVDVVQTPGGTSWHVKGYHPELVPDVSLFVWVVAAVCLISVLLLAAAVTRRLHDSNRRGWWGLLPLPFLATGIAIFPGLFASFGAPGGKEPDMGLFLLLMLNNMVYLGSLGLLVVLLCLGGTRGENRFGPQPL
ncbi:DUF805 domain-containing protein [Sphingomonas sp. LB-2]|uniref:DUF805 domain-containing protein n=1 Tax=Sphingomonas caeni TaxID=2984949 RepID=UPI00222F2D45|nr:DUF805 domain-containing protein [Sphingomonas caeni]MCW3849173.1 DUF805 domain-containing protein [Sphingomonas caeni]